MSNILLPDGTEVDPNGPSTVETLLSTIARNQVAQHNALVNIARTLEIGLRVQTGVESRNYWRNFLQAQLQTADLNDATEPEDEEEDAVAESTGSDVDEDESAVPVRAE